ncbi:MAG TPA: glycosyltransferase family 4 protein [Paenibacillus sp.]|jgi:glycosyltransferase involved in cell wall biosynthesis
MKIAIVPSADLSYNSGSIIYAKNLFKYLHANGHQAFLLGSKKPADIPEPLMPYVIINPLLLEHPIIDDRKVSSQEYSMSLSTVVTYLLDLKKEYGLDIIHAHYGSFNSYGAYMVHELEGVPYVISSFGRDMNIGYICDHRIKWFIDQSLPKASRIIVADHDLRKTICSVSNDNTINERIVEIPMPLDQSIFGFERDCISPRNEPIIATINSCFSPEKGIKTILEAFSNVIKCYPARLIIAGTDDHPEQVHLKYLHNLVIELQIEACTEFVGYLPRSEVGSLLQTADVLVDARTKGNFSSVLLEAMFLNTPVIASDTDAARKVVTDGFNGSLFNSNDAQDLERQLIMGLKDPLIWDEMKQNIQEWVNIFGSEYEDEHCFDQVLELFGQVLT